MIDRRPVRIRPRLRIALRARASDSRDAETMPASSSCVSWMPMSVAPSSSGSPAPDSARSTSSRATRCGDVERAELHPLPVGLPQPLDEHGEQPDGAAGVLEEEGAEVVTGDHAHVEVVQGDHGRVAGAAVLGDGRQLAEQLARAAEAEHELAAVGGRGQHLQPTLDDEQHGVTRVALEQDRGAAAVAPRCAERLEGALGCPDPAEPGRCSPLGAPPRERRYSPIGV